MNRKYLLGIAIFVAVLGLALWALNQALAGDCCVPSLPPGNCAPACCAPASCCPQSCCPRHHRAALAVHGPASLCLAARPPRIAPAACARPPAPAAAGRLRPGVLIL